MQREDRSPSLAEESQTLAREGQSEASQLDRRAREYTVDELAFAIGVPTRTIRFYQFKGVLPPPVRRGRIAVYDDRHVERLRLIGELKDRGLSLRALRHLLRQDSADARLLSGCLSLGESLDRPWSNDSPRTASQDELEELVGQRPPGTIAALVQYGVVARDQTASSLTYRIASPALLRITLELQDSSVEVETAVHAGKILQRRLKTAAQELVDYFSKRRRRGFARSTAPDEIGAALDALRPLAGEAARLIFAREIERALVERSPSNGRRATHGRRRLKGRRR